MATGGNNGGGGLPNGHISNNKSNQVVHMRGDSDSELQALFDSVLQPNQSRRPKQVPLRLRKLPDSFFNPPSTGSKSPSMSVSHSRENSVDSTLNAMRRSPLSAAGGIGASHSRAHSSPASLEQTYSVAAAQPGVSLSQSGSTNNLSDDPLPPGWEQACTPEGQIYFINHITRSTTWEDPRKAQNQQILAAIGNGSGGSASSVAVLSNNSGGGIQASGTAVGPLPEGWEQAITPKGEVYFIDHINRTTSWFDPRIPVHLQRPQVLQQQINAAALAQANANAAAAAAAAAAAVASSNAAAVSLGGAASILGNANVQLARSQEVRLQQLQLERERLKLRQQEIVQQMEKEQARLRQQSRLQQMEDGVELDPFLGGSMVNPSTPGSDFHSRQESADSGLGMGNSYSLPNTPDDYLTMDDNMDTISEIGGTIDAPDIGPLGNDNVESTDDLVPSLHLSADEFSSELLDEVQSIISSKSDNTMTWL